MGRKFRLFCKKQHYPVQAAPAELVVSLPLFLVEVPLRETAPTELVVSLHLSLVEVPSCEAAPTELVVSLPLSLVEVPSREVSPAELVVSVSRSLLSTLVLTNLSQLLHRLITCEVLSNGGCSIMFGYCSFSTVSLSTGWSWAKDDADCLTLYTLCTASSGAPIIEFSLVIDASFTWSLYYELTPVNCPLLCKLSPQIFWGIKDRGAESMKIPP